MPVLSSGVLSQNQFSFTSFNASNGFPFQFQINTNVLNSSLSIKLNQLEGLIYNSTVYSQVTLTNSSNNNRQNLVILLNFLIWFYDLSILEIQILYQ